MVGVFRQKNPGNFFALLVLGILIKLPIFLHVHVPLTGKTDGKLYTGLLQILKQAHPIIFPVLAFSLLFSQAIMLNRFIISQKMMSKPNWFPGMAYILLTTLVPEWNYFSAPLLLNTLLLIILTSLFKIYGRPDAKGIIFNIGLLLGIGALLFWPAISFVFWVLIGFMLMRPFKLNEWVLFLVGVTTPYYFYSVWLIINDNWNWQNLLPSFNLRFPTVNDSLWLAGSTFLLLLPFIMGGYFIQDSLRKMLIQVRKGWSLILLYLFGALLIPFINGTGTLENWVITAIPLAAFHACTYLYSSFRIIPLLIFWASIVFILAYQYSNTVSGW